MSNSEVMKTVGSLLVEADGASGFLRMAVGMEDDVVAMGGGWIVAFVDVVSFGRLPPLNDAEDASLRMDRGR